MSDAERTMVENAGEGGGAPLAGSGSHASHGAGQAVSALPGFDPSRGAVISDCGRYRYRLTRQTSGMGRTVVVMVNPSTADAQTDAPTIRKLCGFGARHRWGLIEVGNLFAYRATDVRELARAVDPVGPENDEHLFDMLCGANQIIFAWGPVTKQSRALRERWRVVAGMVERIGQRAYSIGMPAKCGHPRHPLMLAYAEPILCWPRDSDGSPKGGDAARGSVHDGAGRNGIAPGTSSKDTHHV